MKASELIEEIQGYVNFHGDVDVSMHVEDEKGWEYASVITDTALGERDGKKYMIIVGEFEPEVDE